MGNDIHLRKNHKFLSASGLIKQICQPLAHFKIHLFTYLKNFNTGGQINLSTDPKWIVDYYNLSLYKTSEYEMVSHSFDSALNLWPTDSELLVFKHGREYFNSDYGFTLCQKQVDGCEFFFFSIAATHYRMLNVCLSNLDLFEQFVFYFKDKASSILNTCETHQIYLPKECQQSYPSTSSFSIEALRSQFICDIKGNTLAKWLNNYEALTKREHECLQLLLTNPTTAQLADTLEISKRTAETHLERIKFKLKCSSKQELLMKLAQLAVNPCIGSKSIPKNSLLIKK